MTLRAIPAILALLCAPLRAQDPADVTSMDLEDLLNVRVTSAGRKPQALSDVPAAVYVIPGQELRRTGATSLPEALRRVPGVEVGRFRSHGWAVTARGFNDVFANKLLVLVDGRSVYSPLHSGVFWDVQDVFLEDVERIEVIRGPGGTLWGANAVNGVINVITKKADDTLGGVVQARGGTEERAYGGVRYGVRLGEDAFARVYAQHVERDDLADGLDDDRPAHDAWFQSRAGFRADAKSGLHDRLTATGDVYAGRNEDRLSRPDLAAGALETREARTLVRGAHLLARWERELDGGGALAAQVYYDYTLRDHWVATDVIHTADLDLQHRFRPHEAHEVNWGLGYRVYRARLDGSFGLQVDPETRTDDLVSAFVQDEIAVVPERLRLTLGSKFEHNDYSGFETQPSARLSWTPDDRHALWLAASRSVRTPSIIDHDGRLTPVVAPGLVFSIFGDKDFGAEELLAYEAGYRVQPLDALTLDLAVFHNVYDHLRSGEVGAPFLETEPPPPHITIPVGLENDLQAKAYGAELASRLQVLPEWLLQANVTYLRLNLSEDTDEGRDPRIQVWARSAVDLPWNLAFDLMARYVSRLPAFDLDAYVEADVRLAWRDPDSGLEAAIVGQNLMRSSHPEFNGPGARSEVERGVYASLTWRF